MYLLHKKTIAPGVYGKDSIVGSDSMLKLQSRALKAARELVDMNPGALVYDRIRKGGVITVTVSRKFTKSVIVAYVIRKLVIV